jgi:hypothetical protein
VLCLSRGLTVAASQRRAFAIAASQRRGFVIAASQRATAVAPLEVVMLCWERVGGLSHW